MLDQRHVKFGVFHDIKINQTTEESFPAKHSEYNLPLCSNINAELHLGLAQHRPFSLKKLTNLNLIGMDWVLSSKIEFEFSYIITTTSLQAHKNSKQ